MKTIADASAGVGRLEGQLSAGRALAADVRPGAGGRPARDHRHALRQRRGAGRRSVGQAAMHAAGHVAGQVAADAAIATGITEAVVATTGEGARQAAARLFRRLQTRFAQKRAQWLADFVEKQLLGDLLAELRQGAAVPESIEFRKVEAAMAEVRVGPARVAICRPTNLYSSPPMPSSSSFLRSVVRCRPRRREAARHCPPACCKAAFKSGGSTRRSSRS